MTEQKSILRITVVVMAMFALILDAETALGGAKDGIDICTKVIIPSIFPFLIISHLLTGLLSQQKLHFPAIIRKMLHIPVNAESIFLMGLLGGYPVGAQCITQSYHNGNLRKNDAQRMLSFCNNAGPSFIFGIGALLFDDKRLCWVVWCIHIISALAVGIITPAHEDTEICKSNSKTISQKNIIQRAVVTMSTICGWVLICRIILAFLDQWFLWMLPCELSVLISGLFELANGTTRLLSNPSQEMRFILFSVMLGFGGLCVGLQTYSIVKEAGLSATSYFPGKIIQASISALLSMLYSALKWKQTRNIMYFGLGIVILLFAIFLTVKPKKDMVFFRHLMYNESKLPGGNTYEIVSKRC